MIAFSQHGEPRISPALRKVVETLQHQTVFDGITQLRIDTGLPRPRLMVAPFQYAATAALSLLAQLADKVLLADCKSFGAQNVIGRRGVKIKVRLREGQQAIVDTDPGPRVKTLDIQST